MDFDSVIIWSTEQFMMLEMPTEILITFHYIITSNKIREVAVKFRHLPLCKTFQFKLQISSLKSILTLSSNLVALQN